MEGTSIVKTGKDGAYIVVDLNLFSTEALTSTCYKYTDKFFIHQQTSQENSNLVNVILEVKESLDVEIQSILKQFCNDLIDQQVRITINRDFGHIRDLIVEEAFKPVGK